METTSVRLEVSGAVATISLSRPTARNALDLQMAVELRQAARNAEMDASVRAVLLTGDGPAFCPGGDVNGFYAALPAPEQHLKDIVQPLHDAISILGNMDKPLIVAVAGVAAGAGLGLALCGDLVLASESARFCVAYTAIGASPDGGTSFFLPRRVGLARAIELALDNRVLSASEALAIGLVNAVLPDAELSARALERAHQLASGPTRAYAMTRKLLRQSLDHTLEQQLALEGRGIASMGSTEDFVEGVSAFVEKRKPTFSGR